jgi:WD40 repeat protein
MRLACTVFLAFILTACQPASATTPAISPTQTLPLKETPRPTTTLAPATTQTPAPTSTASPVQLIRRASPICENAFSAPVDRGLLVPPFAILRKEAYADAPSWEFSSQLPHMSSSDANEVKVLFCISETRSQTGTYTDGSPAYQLFWEVRSVSWPGGKVIGRKKFTGSLPPKEFSSGAEEGLSPYKEFAAWIFNQVDHPDFLYFKDAVTSLAMSPDGRLAAFGSAVASQIVDKDYQAQVYLFDPSDLQTGLGTSAYVDVLAGHQGLVTSLAFSPDSKTLASSGYDLFVKFWDVSSGRLLGQVSLTDTPNFLAFSPDGKNLAVASNLEVVFIDVSSMQIERSIPEAGGKNLAFSPDGGHLFIATPFHITVIDTAAGTAILKFPDPSALVPTLTVSEDGNTSVTYETPDAVDNFTLSPDGASIITYTLDQSIDRNSGVENVRLVAWDAEAGKYLNETKFVGDFLGAMKLSADGSLLAIANDQEIWLWDTTSWQVIKRLTGHTDLVQDIVFTPDGRKILSASRDGTVRVWSLEG